jgi:hypothetical protein
MGQKIIYHHLWWILIMLGSIAFALIYLSVPQTRQISNPIHLIEKVAAFFALGLGIATMRPKKTVFTILAFAGIITILVPRLSYLSFSSMENVGRYYTTLYFLLVPGIILLTMITYKAAGGASGKTLKLALYELVVFFSGLLDLTYYLINSLPIPDLIDAPHIVLITGKPISYFGAIVFCLAHIPLLFLIHRVPLEKYLQLFD